MQNNNGKENPEEPYTSKYQKHVACSDGYELFCVGDKFSKPFKSYQVKVLFINSIIKEILQQYDEKRF